MKKKMQIILGIAVLLIIGIIFFLGLPYYNQYEFRKNITSNIPGIVCWGDSLTIGVGGNGTNYPSVLEQLITENIGEIPVYNLGVGGESSKQIMVRNGSMELELISDITIPASKIPVEIKIQLSDGSQAEVLRQGDSGIEEVRLGNIIGSLSIEQQTIASENYTYYFTRDTDGRETTIPSGTNIEVVSSKKYKNDIPIIFMGTNGGWSAIDELIEQIKSIIFRQFELGQERYLVLGLTTGTAEEREELENAMEETFGNRYINLREYLSTDAMDDANLTPTAEDKKQMEVGSVPESLRSDKIHLNATGYRLVGELVYKRMNDCGYFDYKITVD